MSEIAPRQQSDAEPFMYFSLQWLQAVHPQVFTPQSWEHGTHGTRIRLQSPDASTDVNVYRFISLFKGGSGRSLQDEIHVAHETQGTQFNYEFDEAGQLTLYSKRTDLSPHMQGVIGMLSGLVEIEGASITAFGGDHGTESHYVSDGEVWRPVGGDQQAIAVPRLQIAH